MTTLERDATTTRAVERLAGQIADTAVPSGAGLTWRCAPVDALDRDAPLDDIGGSLYEGTAGVAAFLSHLPDHHEVAVGAARHALDHWRSVGPMPGLHAGSLGALAAVQAAAGRMSAPGLAAEARALAGAHLDAVVNDSHSCDVIGGFAGTLLALRELEQLGVDDATRGITTVVQRLREHAVQRSVGRSWPFIVAVDGIEASPAHHRTGLAHGTIGVAAALAGCAGAEDLVEAGLRYEAATWDRRAGDWGGACRTPHDPATWCHGLVGGLAARLVIHRSQPSAAGRAELGGALASLHARAAAALALPELGADHGRNVSICHGLGGVVDVLTTAGVVLGVHAHLATARRLADHLAALYLSAPPDHDCCGTRDGRTHPSLMLGLAGFGATLLRASDPTMPVPSGI